VLSEQIGDFVLEKNLINQWSLTSVTDLAVTPYSHLYQAYSNTLNLNVVVKVAGSRQDSVREAQALSAYAGVGCARLIDYNKEFGAALIEKICPGTSLSIEFPDQDEQATISLCQLIGRLPKIWNERSNIEKLVDRVKALEHPSNNIEKIRLKALELTGYLLASSGHQVFLHGDLHHDNVILSHERGYVAIDPKGVIGEIEYEVAAFMCNPIDQLPKVNGLLDVFENRLSIFREQLGLNLERVKMWTYVHAAMACMWAEEDGVSNSPFLYLARFLENNSFIQL
jgi:streptomycin 6-kinase